MKRKTLCILLMITMFTTAVPISALAAGDVANVNGTNYSSYSEAWNAAIQGGSITLLSDWETSSQLTVPSGIELTIDFNGFSVDRGLSQDEDSEGDGAVLYVEENVVLTLKNGVITGGCSDSGASGIHIKQESQVTLENVSVTGNRSEYWFGNGHGGGIMLDGQNIKLYLKNSHVDHNYAEENGGGIYIADYENCEIYLSENSTISHNTSADGYGGGIYVNGNNTKIIGDISAANELTCSIQNNTCDGDGGGIYVNGDSVIIKNIKILDNVATVDGAGVFVDNEGCTIKDCVITGNKTGSAFGCEGGGVFIDNDGCTLDGCEIRQNQAGDYGGGVYVSSTANVTLSGNLVIKENEAAGTADNLHLNSVLTSSVFDVAFLSGFPTSEANSIGITRGGGTASNVLSSDKGVYDSSIYFADDPDYTVYWDYNYTTGQGSRYLMMTQDPAEVQTQEIPKADIEFITTEEQRLTILEDAYHGYDVWKGITNHCPGYTVEQDGTVTFYYSDGYFAGDDKEYNHHLATMSMAAAMAAGNSAIHVDRDYSNKFYAIKQLLADIGVKTDNIYINESYWIKPTEDTLGIAIGHKELCDENNEGTGEILVPVALRGIYYEKEWINSVNLGSSGEAKGFSDSATKVIEQLEAYILEHGLEEELASGKVRFWVTGFSRSAAIANLVSKRLIDSYTDSGNKVFVYCIAAPQAGCEELEEEDKDYSSIHNIINKGDVVPLFPTKEMGLKRYGVDHYAPGTAETSAITLVPYEYSYGSHHVEMTTRADNDYLEVDLTEGSEYSKRKEEMHRQLAMVAPGLVMDDYFRLATMNYVASIVGLKNMNTEISGGDQMKASEWLEDFVQHAQEWCFNTLGGTNYDGDFRNCYYSGSLYVDGMTLEDAIAVFMGVLYSKTSEESAQIMEAILSNMNNVDMFSIWDDVIGDWDSISAEEREKYIQDLWNILIETDGMAPCAADYLTQQELADLKSAWPVLADVLFRLVSEDYNYDGINRETQVYLGTLLYNMSNIFSNHYPEYYMSWLRTYDSFYTEGLEDTGKETKSYRIDPSQEDFLPNPPVAYIDGIEVAEQYEGSQTLVLSATRGSRNLNNDGVAIYYKLEKTEAGETTATDYELYSGPISLSADEECHYTITAYAMAFTNKSEEVVYSIHIHPMNSPEEPEEEETEKSTEETVEEVTEESTEETADETTEEVTEESAEETTAEESVEETTEETTEEMTSESSSMEEEPLEEMESEEEQENLLVASMFASGSWWRLGLMCLCAVGVLVLVLITHKKRL